MNSDQVMGVENFEAFEEIAQSLGNRFWFASNGRRDGDFKAGIGTKSPFAYFPRLLRHVSADASNS